MPDETRPALKSTQAATRRGSPRSPPAFKPTAGTISPPANLSRASITASTNTTQGGGHHARPRPALGKRVGTASSSTSTLLAEPAVETIPIHARVGPATIDQGNCGDPEANGPAWADPNSDPLHRKTGPAAASSPTSPSTSPRTGGGGRLTGRRLPNFGKLHVYVRSLILNVPVKRPYIILTLGDQLYQTSVASTPTGDWNEGFEFLVTYHTQLFGTCQLDLWDSVTLLPDRHIGRSEIKLQLLEGLPADFTSYYEIWDRKQSAGTVSEVKKREIMSKNIGALQVRVCYQFQRLEDKPSLAERRNLVRVANVHPTSALPKQFSGRKPSRPSITAQSSTPTLRNDAGPASEPTGEKASDPEADPDDARINQEFDRRLGGAQRAANRYRQQTPTDDAATAEANLSDHDTASTVSFEFTTFEHEYDLNGSDVEDGTAGPTATNAPSVVAHYPLRRPVDALSSQPNLLNYLGTAGKYLLAEDTLKVVKSVLRVVYAFHQGLELAPTELLSAMLILDKYYRIEPLFVPVTTDPNRRDMDLARLEVVGRYCKFSMATYGWRGLYFFGKGGRGLLVDSMTAHSDLLNARTYLGLPEEDILAYEFRSVALFQPSYFLAYDQTTGAVVLSVRGTMSTQDTLVDLVCEYQKWRGGLVHSGIKASANWLMTNVMPLALAHAKRLGATKLIIVGHSLGGSAAALLTMMVLEHLLPPEDKGTDGQDGHDQNDEKVLRQPQHRRQPSGGATSPTPLPTRPLRNPLSRRGGPASDFQVHCYAFGPAPCVSRNLLDRYRDHISSYVYRDDLVCRLNYGSVVKLKGMITVAAEMADALPQELLRAGWQFPVELVPWLTRVPPPVAQGGGEGTAAATVTAAHEVTGAALAADIRAHGKTISASDLKWLLRMRQLHAARRELNEQEPELNKLYLPGRVYLFYPEKIDAAAVPVTMGSSRSATTATAGVTTTTTGTTKKGAPLVSPEPASSRILSLVSRTTSFTQGVTVTSALGPLGTRPHHQIIDVEAPGEPMETTATKLSTPQPPGSLYPWAPPAGEVMDVNYYVTSPLERALLSQSPPTSTKPGQSFSPVVTPAALSEREMVELIRGSCEGESVPPAPRLRSDSSGLKKGSAPTTTGQPPPVTASSSWLSMLGLNFGPPTPPPPPPSEPTTGAGTTVTTKPIRIPGTERSLHRRSDESLGGGRPSNHALNHHGYGHHQPLRRETSAESVASSLSTSAPERTTLAGEGAAGEATVSYLRTVLQTADTDDFTELTIRPNMFADHMPNVYEEAFTKARETAMRKLA
ncbi:hypothetical protein IWQ60_000726 [Tieghemiomyces parasiticus]|uniref:sn-1-specific diacylglycerol lipase n=1 Tax=Tieghemiomyces parasiticus TaxID=78921 RepID=A0A9W8AHX6_9FUNG|nr:hypothetical protein IWQ60_000726 [Tieghemiomyces parasiticus]